MPGFFVDGPMWQDLWAALALVLVIEGLLPFAAPRIFRDMTRSVAELNDRALRITGLLSMLAGVVVLYVVR